MALLRAKDAKKMSKKDLTDKIQELKFELVRANVTANKNNAKTKLIKRTLARCITLNNSNREELKK